MRLVLSMLLLPAFAVAARGEMPEAHRLVLQTHPGCFSGTTRTTLVAQENSAVLYEIDSLENVLRVVVSNQVENLAESVAEVISRWPSTNQLSQIEDFNSAFGPDHYELVVVSGSSSNRMCYVLIDDSKIDIAAEECDLDRNKLKAAMDRVRAMHSEVTSLAQVAQQTSHADADEPRLME